MQFVGAVVDGPGAEYTRMNKQQDFIHEQDAPAEPRVLKHFGNYDLVRRIDIGGMGEVYLARQRTAFGREVAVKIIRSDLVHDTTARKRFLREAEVSAYLKHDHILPLIEFSEEQGRLFLVTPYIKGGNLSHHLQNGPLSLSEVHRLFTALVEAVAYVHRRGVVHRDIKPSNILLDQAEDNDRVYIRLIDFGIASLQGAQATAPLTVAGHEIGTAAYMAPERLKGIAAPSNDIFSLGVILYRMLTGKTPSEDAETQLPRALTSVIKQSTASNPDERIASADELLRVFEQAYQQVRHNQTIQKPTPLVRTPSAIQQDSKPDGSTIAPATHSASKPFVHQESPSRTDSATRLKAQTASGTSQRTGTASRPVSTGKASAVTHSRPPSSRPDFVLPPLPEKKERFSGTDYDAPTSYIETKATDKKRAPRLVRGQKLRRRDQGCAVPALAMITTVVLCIIAMVGGGAYITMQRSITATISITPRTQSISEIFELTAKVGAVSNVETATIPAKIFTSTQSGTMDGQTTGKTGCILGILDCKDAVALSDVQAIMDRLRPSLEEQIQQDIDKQAQDAHATTVGAIVFSNERVAPTPAIGSPGENVSVNMSLTGNQAYIESKDAQDMVRQLLQQKAQQDYQLIDNLTQLGQPVVQRIEADGSIKIAIAAAGVARYTIPQAEMERLQNSMKGKTIIQAREFLKTQKYLDPEALSVRVTVGDTIPEDVRQIQITTLDPADIPRVQLKPVPTPPAP